MVLDPEDGTKERQQKQRSMLIQKKLTVDFLEADRINALPMCCNKLDRKTLNQKLF